MTVPTPHIGAKQGEIAETILLPGDPLRAKYIAETFLEDVTQFNTVRNMFGYTGTFQGKRISVMGTGMGVPSIGIYSYELIAFYGVKNLIRIGTAGSLHESVKIRDVVIGMGASTNSNFAHQYDLPGTFAPLASYDLVKKAADTAAELGMNNIKVGNILTSDVFYDADPESWKKWSAMGIMAVEMEAAALYMNAAKLGAKALCILTISDSLVTHESTTAEERQETFTDMMQIALRLAD
ncbi:MAG: purine-nucleoside phosphorylase [Culicoidibacterales bacterium]